MQTTIELTWYEMMLAIECGVQRNVSSWKSNLKNNAGYVPKDLFDTNIKGAAAEMAVAKALDMYWDGSVDTFKGKADVGFDIEVRMTDMRIPKLIFRPGDPVDRKYVLAQNLWVNGGKPKFELLGWLEGKKAKRKKFLTDNGNGRKPAYFVPVNELNLMRDL